MTIPTPPAANDGKLSSERNVRVDVTITLKGDDKTVAKIAVAGRRAMGDKSGAGRHADARRDGCTAPNMPPSVSYRDVGINVDAAPQILPSGKVSVSLKLNFSNVLQVPTGGGERPSFGNGSQEVNGVVFESGKPLVVLAGGRRRNRPRPTPSR